VYDIGIVRLRGAVGAGAHCGDLAGDIDVILNGHRHAQQRQPLTAIKALLRARRLSTGSIPEYHPVGIQLRIQSRDPVQVELHERRRGDRTIA
jgi:hypothetical protein